MVINPGDVWIIEEPTWPYSCDTTSLDNGNPLAVTTINMPTNNFVDETLVIESPIFEQLGVFPDDRRRMLAKRDHVLALAGF